MKVKPLRRRPFRDWWLRHYGPMVVRAECGHLNLVLGIRRYGDGCNPWDSCRRCHRKARRQRTAP